MKIIGIDYDEFHPGTYRAVELSEARDLWAAPARFSTGDPVADYRAALEAAGGGPISASSSVDNFISDAEEAGGLEVASGLGALRDGGAPR